MKPFDLEAAKAGAPLVTRDGRKARFIAHVPECIAECRVIALIEDSKNGKFLVATDELGKYCDLATERDLFIAEEEKKPVVRWLWARRDGKATQSLYSESEIKDDFGRAYPIRLEWSRTEFPE